MSVLCRIVPYDSIFDYLCIRYALFSKLDDETCDRLARASGELHYSDRILNDKQLVTPFVFTAFDFIRSSERASKRKRERAIDAVVEDR